jgi:hypothetical protein
MGKQLLHGTDTIASFEQVGGEGIPEGMEDRSLGKPCLPSGLFDSQL